MKMLFSSSSTIRLFIFLFIILCTSDALVKIPENETVPAVIVFGDSIVDPGNNNNRATIAKSNFPPYGQDFDGGKPTGRFSNGRIPSDFIAEELGIKKLVPAYLDPNLQPDDLLTGVSFASGASGYDPLTSKLSHVLSLSDQLELFKDYIGKLKAMVGEEGTNSILSQSLFLLVQGSNDIAEIYPVVRKGQYDFPTYADFLVGWGSSFLKELYGLGARRIGVFCAPPLGCLPSLRSIGGGKQRECVDNINEESKLFNAKLSYELDSLNTNFPLARFVYVDIYNPLLGVIQNPQNSGFEVVDKGCCGTGLIEVALLCNKYNPFTCDDVSKYVFWDSFHPTERVYKNLISGIIQQYVNKFL